MVTAVAIAAVALTLFLLRAPDRAADAQRAQVGDVVEPAAQTDVPEQAQDSATDEVLAFESAELMFTGSSALGEQPGFFETVSGQLVLGEDGTPKALRGTVQMASVLTNADSLTAKLKSEPGMFEVEKYPTAQFVSTAIRPVSTPGAEATHEIEGNFTLRGITRSIRFPAKIEVTPAAVTLQSEFSVNRQEFGVNYEGGTAFPEIRDLVLINLDLEASRTASPPAAGGEEPSSNTLQSPNEPTTRPVP